MRMTMRMIFKREGTLAGGEWPGRRCRGGALGPARALIFGWQPINSASMAGFQKTGLLAANAFVATRSGAMKYFFEKVFWPHPCRQKGQESGVFYSITHQ